ncbi:MAG: hypothetical protein GY739_20755 [Mesoflavibacter sp.]|nr:hypothetical protein [Mesoflavibacter sp.]
MEEIGIRKENDNLRINELRLKEEIKKLKATIKKQSEQLRLHSVSNSVAIEYAEFYVMCDRKKLPLLCLEDYIKQYCR